MRNMKRVIFGGTTEGRELSLELAGLGAEVTVSVASEYGAEEQGEAPGITVVDGLKDEDAIRELIRGTDLVVDATHPYAVIVTENVRKAAEAEGVERLRLVRENTMPGTTGRIAPAEDAADPKPEAGSRTMGGLTILPAEDPEDAAKICRDTGGNILLTTGSKDLKIYASAIPAEKLFPRVLPLVSSIEAAEEAGIPHRNIIAVQGPFSEELNRAVIRDYGIDILVTKESGKAGGFEEKIRACEACGIPAVVIRRPEDAGLPYEEVLRLCRAKLL